MHGVGVVVGVYCEQYSRKYGEHYFVQRFSLVVSHHQGTLLSTDILFAVSANKPSHNDFYGQHFLGK